MLYAGIGSRRTPLDVLKTIQAIGRRLGGLGFTLRTGAADGADKSFMKGCEDVNGLREIWIPWMYFERVSHSYGKLPTQEHFQIAASFHPAWHKLTDGAKALHARNIGQILGEDCKTPVQFVVCWTPDGCESDETRSVETGGTGTAISLASRNNIPIYNLFNFNAMTRLAEHVNFLKR